MENPFSKFEKFGSICDSETRKIIAQSIFDKLLFDANPELEDENSFFLSDEETENFATPVKLILANPVLREMTVNNPELAESTTQEILNFIHKTKRTITALGNPYQDEVKLLDSFSYSVKSDYKHYWKPVKEFLKETYVKRIIDTNFYTTEFRKTMRPKSDEIKLEGDTENQFNSYESVRDHLAEKWREEVLLKIVDYQQEQIELLQKEFSKILEADMEALKQQAMQMHSFVTDFSQIFDFPEEGLSKENFEVLKKYHQLLEMNHAVKDLVEMLGRMRQAMEDEEVKATGAVVNKVEWKAKHASPSDLIGIRESDDINNLLPSETVLLSDPILQTLFFKKFAEKKLQTFEFEDKVMSFDINENKKGNKKGRNQAKGPFIICVDTSGSMHGMPETIAKTICLAILKIALKEKRNCYLITFSVAITTLDMSDLKNNMDEIVKFLSMSFHGGTDASPALAEATKMLDSEEYNRADILMISDFQMPQIHPTILSRIQKAKENKTKFHSLVIDSLSPIHSNPRYQHLNLPTNYGWQNFEVTNGFDHNWHFDPRDKNSVFLLAKDLKNI